MRRLAFLALPSLVLALAAAAACSGNRSSGFDDGPDSGGGSSGGGSSSSSSSGSSGFGDASVDQGGPQLIAEVWGHSATTLYKLDPDTKAVTTVGNFSGCSSIVDIALDGESNLYGTTNGGLYKIDKASAKCTLIKNGSYPNSLSFVPKGTVDPAAEALVGYDGGDYIRIDTTTGAITKIGAIGGGLVSSGDIVSVKDGPTYLTVKGTSACTSNDCLVEVDPKTGKMVKNWGSVGYSDVFGLAFWAGSIYGFSNDGELFEVTLTGGSLKTNTIPIPSKPANLSFWGAGSTTSAPVTPIPK
mgnify:CR=1 FL=1